MQTYTDYSDHKDLPGAYRFTKTGFGALNPSPRHYQQQSSFIRDLIRYSIIMALTAMSFIYIAGIIFLVHQV